MTKTELRVLYLLNKHGGQCRHSQLQQAMSRIEVPEREAALVMLEGLDLVKSGKAPTRTRPALLVWLTQAGKEWIQDAIARGELGEPE